MAARDLVLFPSAEPLKQQEDELHRPSASILQSWASSQVDKSHRDRYSTSTLHSLSIGTGASIISSAVSFILENPPRELIFVTCFWASSTSLSSITHLLHSLSAHATATNMKIRVRICLSSLSLLQKLAHTSSPSGHMFTAKDYPRKLHLPRPEELPGLDIQIKSVFIRPFSVMHSKFILLDRRICLLPSCNVSWEEWFEGCADLRGEVVQQMYEHFESFWGRGDPVFSLSSMSTSVSNGIAHPSAELTTIPPFGIAISETSDPFADPRTLPAPLHLHTVQLQLEPLPTLLLPHPYHRHPRFRPLPSKSPPIPPSTPLNDLLLHLFLTARRSIFLRTPNLTCGAVIHELLTALERGVEVHIITNRRMMVLEQIITAGTTGEQCVRGLLKRYQAMKRRRAADVELGEREMGELKVEFFDDSEIRRRSGSSEGGARVERAVKTHMKCTIVDERVVVLGSGNLDRASWFTSQEVGVAIEDVSGDVMRSFGELARRYSSCADDARGGV